MRYIETNPVRLPAELMCSDRPVTVYLRWKEQDLLSLIPLVRLLIDELTTTYDNSSRKTLYSCPSSIGEGGRTAIPNLHDAATTVCGRGISIWLAIQSLSQLEATYGRARANVLRGNMETHVYYRPNDLTTARYLEERLGSVSAYAHSQTLHSGEETSEGRSERPIPLVSKQDIAQLSDSAVIAFTEATGRFALAAAIGESILCLLNVERSRRPSCTRCHR